MFEKEAEEYVRKIRYDVKNWDGAEPKERFYNEIKFKQAYLAGAEFGYSKSNEQLTKAKELIKELSSSLSVVGECEEEECELLNQAEQFLRKSE